MPLWFSLPAVLVLGVSAWISGLDPNVNAGETALLCAATIAAAAVLALRLLRLA